LFQFLGKIHKSIPISYVVRKKYSNFDVIRNRIWTNFVHCGKLWKPPR